MAFAGSQLFGAINSDFLIEARSPECEVAMSARKRDTPACARPRCSPRHHSLSINRASSTITPHQCLLPHGLGPLLSSPYKQAYNVTWVQCTRVSRHCLHASMPPSLSLDDIWLYKRHDIFSHGPPREASVLTAAYYPYDDSTTIWQPEVLCGYRVVTFSRPAHALGMHRPQCV